MKMCGRIVTARKNHAAYNSSQPCRSLVPIGTSPGACAEHDISYGVKTRKAHFEQFSAASPRTADMTGRAARVAGPREACRVSVFPCTNHRNGLFGKLKLTKCAPGRETAPGFFMSAIRRPGCAPEACISVWLLASSQVARPCCIPGRPAKRARLAAGHNRGSLFPPCIFRNTRGAKGACVIADAPTLILHAKFPGD